ncbi:MAG: SHOCT domain-containing protein [Sulfuricella sp.]
MWLHVPWEWFPLMWIFPLIFLIVMLLFLLRGGGGDWPMCGRHGTHKREESARELLDRRYARGEISREDYQQMKKDLE